MHRKFSRYCGVLVLLGTVVALARAQAPPPASPPPAPHPQPWTWEQVKDRLELNNPTLLAGKLNINELQAEEITAHLRPNPNLALLSDQLSPLYVGPSQGLSPYLM